MRTVCSILLMALASCTHHEKLVNVCEPFSSTDPDYELASAGLARTMDDTAWVNEFNIRIKEQSYFLKDIRNSWEHDFGTDYFDVIVKDYTKEYVLIYCPRSGIQAGYKIFGNREHDVYLIDRRDGQIVKSIEIVRGLDSGLIYKNAIFLKFFEPNDVYRCKY